MQLTLLTTLLPLLSITYAKTTSVDVGEDGLKFDPDTVTAAVGDKLEFHFYPKAHSVAQSSFNKPCIANETGIWSGFMPVASGEGNQTFTVTINSTEPLWLYCSQVGHCAQGMAMVVNPPKSGNTLQAYKDAAGSVKTATSPKSNTAQLGVVAAATESNSTSNGTSSSMSSPSGTATAAASGTSSAPASSTTSGAAVKLDTAGAAVMGLAGLIMAGMV